MSAFSYFETCFYASFFFAHLIFFTQLASVTQLALPVTSAPGSAVSASARGTWTDVGVTGGQGFFL